MNSVIRRGTLWSLAGLTALAGALAVPLKVLALPTDQVVQILQGIPVFTIADKQGAPLVAVDDKNQKVSGVFISQQDAQKFFTDLKSKKPDVAGQVSVQPVSLGEVMKITAANLNKPDSLKFAYVPEQSQVQVAQRLLGKEYQGGVPLYVARGGKEQGYLTIQQNNEQVIPFFFEEKQINEMVERFKKDKPDLAATVKVEVVIMENVLATLLESNDAMLSKIRLVPTEAAIQYIRSIAAQQPPAKK
ncbi:MAG: hypothetical protein GC158_06695 [Cyanobacteria bacterium RI_101]|jgi:hypothetical protein|nr:hypothetical protein [Cyanobacteria bacterium RI_101]